MFFLFDPKEFISHIKVLFHCLFCILKEMFTTFRQFHPVSRTQKQLTVTFIFQIFDDFAYSLRGHIQ